MERTGAKFGAQKLASVLGVARQTLMEYMAFLEGTYFLKVIKPHTVNKDVEIRKSGKIYICDPGLVRQFSQVDEGALFEYAVFWNLQRAEKVQYYQRKNGAEIDFVVNGDRAYEVKLHASREDFNKLQNLARNIGIESASIVSREYVSMQDVLYLFNL